MYLLLVVYQTPEYFLDTLLKGLKEIARSVVGEAPTSSLLIGELVLVHWTRSNRVEETHSS